MRNKIVNGKLQMVNCKIGVSFAALLLFILAGMSSAAGIKVVPSAPKVSPGESFYADVVVEGVPSEGLGAVQFRLNVSAPGSVVTSVSDISQGLPADVSVAAPLLIGPATTTRSGIGDFFWNVKSSHGILVMENEALQNGTALYTFGHTNGAALPSGNGSVARFRITAGSEAAAEKIILSLSDVALLDGSTVYPLENNIGAIVDLKCYTQVPNLIGLTNAAATSALTTAKLVPGSVYEIDNMAGAHALNIVLVQSATPGATILCETPVDLAINTAPVEVNNVQAADKTNDESGAILLSWAPSSSSDAAGYRVYNAAGVRLTEIGSAASTGVELSGQPMGTAVQLRIIAYDTYGNESAGVTISAQAVDDVAPRITVTGVAQNAFYASDVHPVITVQEANLAAREITLNGTAYNQLPISIEESYLLRVSATDTSGNNSVKEITFTVDKTAPIITVIGITKNAYYNHELAPAVLVSDANLDASEILLNGSAFASGSVITAENNYELKIQAMDKAGNSSSDSYPFFIDKTKPMSAMTIGTPRFEQSGVLYVAGGTLFTLTGSDAGTVSSGIDKLEYRANSAVWSLYQAPITLAGLNDGAAAIDSRAADKATNVEDFHTRSVTLDTTPPVTSLAIGQPQYIDAAGAAFVTQHTGFTLSAEDSLSGTATTEYKIDSGAWTIAATFTISDEGSHTVRYFSKDNLGNTETEKSLVAIVDKTAPVTTITTGDPKYTAANGKLYVTGNSQFTLSATDSLSGVALTQYRIDGGAWTAYAPFGISAEGSHTIEYYSKDNVSNTEAVQSLTVIVDNTAPVTTITTGEPKYTAADGKLYVTSRSTFTLSATDNLSGVAATEYRIDGGAWTAYAPFSISTEGSHTIEYRSSDNALNLEATQSLAALVDNTPPDSSIDVGAPRFESDGRLYIGGSAMLSINSVDGASGVKTAEYRIDSGSFIAYIAPFTLAALTDGEHTILYRAMDNVGNSEPEKKITVMLDKTPPVTTISASDPLLDGLMNTVSPKTTFTLDALDNLVGVKRISYSIDSGPWQAYFEGFTLAGLAAGRHLIAYKATDNVLNEESVKTIMVRLIVIEVEKKIAAESVVLVGVWSDNSDKVRKDLDLVRLNGILSSLNITYSIAGTMDEFTAALRSGRFTTYLLIDVKEPVVGEEIREAVHYGDGLIYIKTQPNADPFLDDVFGLKFTGKTTNSDLTVTLLDSPISNEGSLLMSGKGVVSSITNGVAQTLGLVKDKQAVHPAIVLNQYGRGRAIIYTFDLLAGQDQTQAAALLINSLNHVRPSEHYARALGSSPVRIKLNNAAWQIDVKVIELIPANTSADTIIPQASYKDAVITWQEALGADEHATFGYYLNLPDLSGRYVTSTELRYQNGGEYRLYGNYGLTLNVTSSAKELLQAIIADLIGVTPANSEDARKIADAVDILYQIRYEAADRKQAEQNIKSLLNAVDIVRGLSSDATAIRLKVDELLKIWEKKWYQFYVPK